MAATLAELLLLGLLAEWLLRRFTCPGLVGMLALGVLFGPFVLDMIAPEMLAISDDLRRIALIVILLRAGLKLSRRALTQVGGRALLLSCIPASVEMAAITLVAPLLLDLTTMEAALLGATVAAISPAVVVPMMLRCMDEGRGRARSVPDLVLAAASVDDVYVIVVFGALLSMYLGDSGSIAWQAGGIPVAILLGVVIGVLLGWACHRLFLRFDPRATKRVLILLGVSILLLRLQNLLDGLIPFAALLAVMSTGFILLERDERMAHEISAKLAKIWILAEILLFTLVGAQVDLAVAWSCGLAGAAVIALGLLLRATATMICLLGSPLRRNERLFVTIAFLPKATVQAAIGGSTLVALQARGLPTAPGEIILAVAVLSIVLTATPAAWAISLLRRRLLPVETVPENDAAVPD